MTKLQEKAENAPLGIYLHVPFCARSCDFCHFYQEVPKREEINRYLKGMETNMEQARLDRMADTVFWGGGTPGLLPPKDLERLCQAVLQANGGHVPKEWTVEMAPATVKPEKIRLLKAYGVNRISMGVQSFQPALLEALGRIHSLEQVWKAIDILQEEAVESINLDLIFAIPGQSLEMWRADLRSAMAVQPHHLSTYCLTFEEDTALWLRLQKGQVIKLDEDAEAGFFEVAWEELGAAGFEQYEVSNYAQPGHACQHNLNTWQMEEWIGYGPSASSQFDGKRWTEPHSLDEWLQGQESGKPRYADEVLLTREMLAQDALVFGLRMNAGLDERALASRFGPALPAGWPAFRARLIEAEYAEVVEGRIRLTPQGRLLADRIGAELLALDEA